MSARIVVSQHARERWDERVGWRIGLRDVEGAARSAWQRGEPDERPARVGEERRVYMGVVFVFKPAADRVLLVTVIPPRHGGVLQLRRHG